MEAFQNIGYDFDQADWFVRLLFAILAGAILGFDREVRHRRVGIRTYMMVSLGSAIFLIATIEMSFDLSGDQTGLGATRAVQGLIGGLGFLGAGAIIQGQDRVGGMATAASPASRRRPRFSIGPHWAVSLTRQTYPAR